MELLEGISFVLPSYREADNLRQLFPEWKQTLDSLGENYEILVVDTAKPLDDTENVCQQYGAVYINQESPGLGGAFKTAIKYAKYDKLFISDADGSHAPRHIPAIYKKFLHENCDVVIGSRYVKGGKTNDGVVQIAMSHILNTVFGVVIGLSAKDLSTNFRIYRTEQLKKIENKNPLSRVNYDFLEEILLKLKLQKPDLVIGESAITFEKRLAGESKRQLIKFIVEYAQSIFFLLGLRFPMLRNMFLYGIFGVIAAGIDFLAYSCMVNLSLSPEISSIIGNACGFVFTYLMNTFVNFKKKDKKAYRFFSYFAIVVLGAVISTLLISVGKSLINIYLLKIIVILTVTSIQFVLNKVITYHK